MEHIIDNQDDGFVSTSEFQDAIKRKLLQYERNKVEKLTSFLFASLSATKVIQSSSVRSSRISNRAVYDSSYSMV